MVHRDKKETSRGGRSPAWINRLLLQNKIRHKKKNHTEFGNAPKVQAVAHDPESNLKTLPEWAGKAKAHLVWYVKACKGQEERISQVCYQWKVSRQNSDLSLLWSMVVKLAFSNIRILRHLRKSPLLQVYLWQNMIKVYGTWQDTSVMVEGAGCYPCNSW